jgi:DNA invertase Pin-like site-specific DNA recombinase
MNEAIGYTRLSQSSDTSIPRQKEHIRAYADAHGFELTALYDDGERSSGFDSSRVEFQKVRGAVSEGGIDAILVNDKRRLARDFDETMRLILDCRENDVAIHTHQDGQLDISDPMNAAIEVVQAASDYEAKKKEIAKAKEAVEERQESGCYHGTPPFGLRFAPDKCHLEKAEPEWTQLQEIINRRENGENITDIAEAYSLDPSTVSRITNRGFGWYETRLEAYSKS